MAEQVKKIFPLVNFSVNKRVTITMLILIVVVFGILSLSRLPLDMMPDISFPVITVATQYSGVAPEEIEQFVTIPLEGVIAGVNGVKKVSSSSSESYSTITVEFEWGTDLDYAAQDIKDNISRIREYLPDGIQEPMVMKFNLSQMPVVFLGVSGLADSYELKKFLENNVQERIQRLDGVAQVLVVGGRQHEIFISIDPIRLKGKGLSIDGIINGLRGQNFNTPAGYFTKSHTDYLLRAMGQFKSIEDIRSAIVGMSGDGTPVRLYEVADVKQQNKEVRSVMRMNGKESVFLIMNKRSGANTLNVSKKINKELDILKKRYPDLVFYTIFDQGLPVKQVTESTTMDAIYGSLLAVLLLLIFLGNIRPTLIIFMAIPLSIIATFIVLYTAGFTLNLMTLGGLALGIGRLIDDAIVVIENIFRHLEKGETPVEAARSGASEVSLAISASTFTTIIAFLPILFSQGLASQLTRGMCLTIMFALLASLFVAYTIVPMLSSIFFRKPKKDYGAWFNIVKGWYEGWLTRALDNPVKSMGIVIIVLILSIVVGVKFVGKEFMPQSDSGMMLLKVEMPVGTPVEETAQLCGQIEKMLVSVPEVQYVGEVIGRDESAQGGHDAATGPNSAQMFVRLINVENRQRSQMEIQDLVRARLPLLKNAKVTLAAMSGFGSGGKPVTLKIYGKDLAILRDVSTTIMQVISSVNGLKDIESSFSQPRPEYHFIIDRQKALLYGLAPIQIQQALQAANLGIIATQLHTGEEEIDMRVILDKKYRTNLEYLTQLPLKTPTGTTITLSQVAALVSAEGPLSINRDNKFRVGTVDANISGRPLGAVVKDVKMAITSIEKALPEGYSIVFGGEFQDMQETFGQLALALLLAILLIYMVMASQFESLMHPFVIMFTIPLASIGVVWILLLFGKTLSVVSFVGIIILTGIVASNGIVLVDYINQLREKGADLRQALIEGGKTRLRPVVITATVTICAMVPMALSTSQGSEMRAPMALTVIGGLISATFLTIFVIPIVYQYSDRLSSWMKKIFKSALD
ncbi:MAG: efflux RND transporter permease subunit [Chitinivibrionales bacterium]|nr:efflux RND transporter permease subunit [Chitinivibrionales bacterium]